MEDGDARVCSFCGNTEEQVRKLIAGPGVHMCDECIAFGTEFLAEASEERSSEQGEPAVCSFCGTATPAGATVASSDGVHICKQCVDLGQKAIDQAIAERPSGP